MFTIIVMSIISSGFVVIRFTTDQFYRLHRYSGQLLYLKAVFIGTVVTAFSIIIDSFFSITKNLLLYFPNHLEMMNNHNYDELGKFILIWFLSLVIAFIFVLLKECWIILIAWWNFGWNDLSKLRENAKILLIYKLLKDSPLDTILLESFMFDKYLLISMSDRKVYVGRVINLGEPNEHLGPDQEILILPVYSGYRDKDTLSLKLTAAYETDEDIAIVLRQDNILSACEFIPDLYRNSSQDSNYMF